MPTSIEKSPGWDWEVDYEDEDGTVETMSVFGQIRVEDAVAEARHSLNANFFRLPDFVPPAIVAVRRV